MPNAPVYYALVQAQFNPIALMAKYAASVQDVLRHHGYSLFDPQEITQLQFVSGAGQAPAQPEVVQGISWLLSKADRSSGFILSPSSLTFHTTRYTNSEEFLPELLLGLRAVHDIVALEHVSRLGLRYLDAVIPAAEESVEQYLAAGLHGIDYAAPQRYALNETVFETQCGPCVHHGTLVARIHRMHGAIGYPPDLIPSGLASQPRLHNEASRRHAIIDTDHFVEGHMPLDFDRLREQLVSLHASLRKIFDATITDHARSVWNQPSMEV